MWVAPSMWPCTHSSSSRTSRTTASSGSSSTDTVGTCCGITGSIVARAARTPVTARMEVMTTAPPPVRDPAWSLPREAIGLWTLQSVIGACFLGLAVGAFLLFVPPDVGGPIPVLRWLLPIAVGLYVLV